MTYFFTTTRDGQRTQRSNQMFANNMEEAIAEFSASILKDIANSSDYTAYFNESDFKTDFPNQKYEGAGYYICDNTPSFGRKLYYSFDAKFDSYREDVYTYGIEEVEEN